MPGVGEAAASLEIIFRADSARVWLRDGRRDGAGERARRVADEEPELEDKESFSLRKPSLFVGGVGSGRGWGLGGLPESLFWMLPALAPKRTPVGRGVSSPWLRDRRARSGVLRRTEASWDARRLWADRLAMTQSDGRRRRGKRQAQVRR